MPNQEPLRWGDGRKTRTRKVNRKKRVKITREDIVEAMKSFTGEITKIETKDSSLERRPAGDNFGKLNHWKTITAMNNQYRG